jgi:hypothetical protein
MGRLEHSLAQHVGALAQDAKPLVVWTNSRITYSLVMTKTISSTVLDQAVTQAFHAISIPYTVVTGM